ncbi:ABC-type glycerol-3-phosphate transport system substrate-binding protein [Allocatelliglobosispora scoriae]|uniref:ABC-type glycerol-3-phosphate transport system substrate-binding protein n=1 Tax=Allocatelliglobosispora scoriae TaxID=643052 RepID=A0A841BQ91_9ACTN|nr:extracellular solute-binding protein [Allocatelliglobosispora scoriae]MBB5868990.1 ABC-type glycerol-3-phosphate transport system substrate-binding protein [Allocatelliglobosispora scoriae]
MDRRTFGKSAAALLIAGSALLTAACGTDEDKTAAGGPVTLVVNGLPPSTDAVNRANFEADVKAFEAKYPNIKISAKEGFMDPQTFSTKLAGGQLEDVFYVYFTDPQALIAKKQVSDISSYLGDFPVIKDVKPSLMKVFSGPDGKVYGLPSANYSLGLVYSRTLFTKAGLDPNSPPKTWEEVREYAKKIAALGTGYVGYGDYSKSNTGGWHFTAETYSVGGDIAVKDGDTWKAAFNNDKGKQVLQQLKDMRWTDNTMGQRQLLEWADLLQMMAGGKLGMYVGSGDNLPAIVNQFKGKYEDLGLGAIPGGQATLGGGDGYMFKAGLSAEKIKAGLTWLTFKSVNPDRIDADNAKAAAAKQPVGAPEPNIWTGASEQKLIDATKKHANIPSENFAPFVTGSASIQLKLEPPLAQQVYAVLDTVMQKVLTDKNADIDALLAAAEKQVNQVLAAAK